MKKVATIYLLGMIISWCLIAGWETASLSAQYPGTENRTFIILHSTYSCLFWPLTVPMMYFTTEAHQYGWKLFWEGR